MKIYNVGPLFTEAEKKQRQYEGKKICYLLESNGVEFELSNPIDMPTSNQLDVTSSEIYQADYERLNQADVVFFDLSNEDSGSCVALGIIMEKKIQGKNIQVYPIFHDIRLSRNGQSGLESSCGFNSMVVGILKGNGVTIYESFEDAFAQFAKDFHLYRDLHLEEIQNVNMEDSYELFMSFAQDENGFINSAYGMSFEEYQEFVVKSYRESKGIGLPEWKVPQTIYLLMTNDKPVGVYKVRHYLNDVLKESAGHIGFAIHKEYRNLGLGTKGLALALEKAWAMIPEEEIHMAVYKDNEASIKIQIANGAYIHHEDALEYFTRIRK